MRPIISYRTVLREVWRPGMATAAAAAAGWLLGTNSASAVAVFVILFATLMLALRVWPAPPFAALAGACRRMVR